MPLLRLESLSSLTPTFQDRTGLMVSLIDLVTGSSGLKAGREGLTASCSY